MDLLSNLWMAVENMVNLKGVQMIAVDLSATCLELLSCQQSPLQHGRQKVDCPCWPVVLHLAVSFLAHEDMGEFIAAVQNRFVFQTCVSRRLGGKQSAR